MSSEQEKKQQGQSEQQPETNQVAYCGQACIDIQDKLLRVTADFQNYKTRTEKERMQSIQLGQVTVITKMLTIVDDVDRALEEAKKQGSAHINWLAGFDLIAKSLHQLLADYNVRPIEQVHTFDPELHEALTQVDAPNTASGAIVTVLQKGYMVDNRVLRPTKVTVAK